MQKEVEPRKRPNPNSAVARLEKQIEHQRRLARKNPAGDNPPPNFHPGDVDTTTEHPPGDPDQLLELAEKGNSDDKVPWWDR